MNDAPRKTRKVMCSVPNGIELHRYAPGYDDGTGQKPLRRQPGGVTLRGPSGGEAGVNNLTGEGVENIVDAEFIDAWMSDNKDSELVTGGHIVVVKDDEERRDGHE